MHLSTSKNHALINKQVTWSYQQASTMHLFNKQVPYIYLTSKNHALINKQEPRTYQQASTMILSPRKYHDLINKQVPWTN